MRIVDILHQDDGSDGDGDNMDTNKRRGGVDPTSPPSSATSSSSSVTSSSTAASYPLSLLSRWFLALRKPSPGGGGGGGGGLDSPRWCRKKKNKKGKQEEEEEGGGDVASPPAPEPAAAAAARTDGLTGVPPPESLRRGSRAVDEKQTCAELSIPQGRKPDNASFSLGMGAGLILLLARSATEFSKVTELQRQLETLLKEIKDVVQSKGTVLGFSESNNNIAFSASDCCGVVNTSLPRLLNYDTSSENRSCPKMDQLEAELEIELERLQLNLEGEDSAIFPGANGMELARENNDPSEIFSISFGEDEEHQSEICGVPAWELERRLHELLETRQRERIAELEAALECAERNLREKEIEVSWWRDTASRSSQHLDVTLLM